MKKLKLLIFLSILFGVIFIAYLKIEPKIKKSVLIKAYEQKNHKIYYREIEVKDADYNSFEEIDIYYGKDKNYVYYMGEKIDEIDSNTFKNFSFPFYIMDKNGIYYQENFNKYKKIENIDISSFEILDSHYSKDKDTVYCKDIILKEADVKSFKIIENNFTFDAEDKNNYYQVGKMVKKK